MTSTLREIFEHNAWANQRILSFLTGLTPALLEASSDAVYGNVALTMHHVLSAEAAYWSFFSGRMPDWYQPETQPASIEQLPGWCADIAACWQAVPLDDLDADAVLERTRRDGSMARLRTGVILAQTIHHGNVHREQVSHVLTVQGIEAPDLSLYSYAREADGA